MSTFVHNNGRMTAPPGAEGASDTELGRYMDDRRNDLGLTWDDVANACGLSRQTLYDIRNGNTDYRRMRSSTKRKIEKALQWEHGGVDAAIAHGRRPAPSGGTGSSSSADSAAVPPGWTEEEEQRWLVARETLAALKLKQDLTRAQYRVMRDEYAQMEARDHANRGHVTPSDRS